MILINISNMSMSYSQSNNVVLMEGFSSGSIDKEIIYTQSGLHFITNSSIYNKIILESDIFVLDQGFAQALIGPKFPITNDLYLSVLIGLVNMPNNPIRLGGTLIYQTQHWEGLVTYQWGPQSSYFYIYEWARKIKKIVIGIRGQRFLNTGLFLGGQISNTIRIWTQSGYNFEINQYSIALGISALFHDK